MTRQEFFTRLIAFQSGPRITGYLNEQEPYKVFMTSNPELAWHYRALREASAMQAFREGDARLIQEYLTKYGSCLCAEHWTEVVALIGKPFKKPRGRQTGIVVSGEFAGKKTSEVAFWVRFYLEGGLAIGKAIERVALQSGMTAEAVRKCCERSGPK